ncbi:aminopeptidase Q-like [Ctenocephalides felis]|uniref:aminopeptidase Q-like n=1 Tax=Ctenocephalides felis TaxID=7515 RepID=UPI000E6E4739|nr:aminopeptidase Q-like [Ctenocephalides felis]
METLSFRDPCTRSVEFTNGESKLKRKGLYMTKFTFFLSTLILVLISVIIGFTVHYLSTCRLTENPKLPSNTNIDWNELILPKNIKPSYYRLLIRPSFDLEDNVYKYEGTIWITLSAQNSTKQIDLNSKDLTITKVTIVDHKKILNSDKLQMPFEEDEYNESKMSLIPKLVKYFQLGDFMYDDLTSTPDSTIVTSENPVESTISSRLTVGSTTSAKMTSEDMTMMNILEPMESLTFVLNETTEIVSFYLKEEMEPGVEYMLEILFSGEIKHEYSEFYWKNYMDNGESKLLLSTNLRPTLARSVFPCFDEPTIAAPFEIAIQRKLNMQSVSNSILKQSMNKNFDLVWDYFQPTPPITPSSVFFMVSELSKQDIQINDNTSLTVWSKQELVETVASKIDFLKSILETYYKILESAVPQPLNLNLVVIPGNYYNGDAAHGVVILKEMQLLDSNLVSTQEYLESAKIISKQIACSLLTSMVQINDLSGIWIPEAIFKYLSQMIISTIEPSQMMVNRFLENVALMERDSMRVALLNMYQNVFGVENFMEIIRSYINKVNATDTSNFWKFLNKHLTESIKSNNPQTSFVDAWITSNGYPIVNATINLASGSITLYQNKFSEKHPTNFSWNIPISFTSSHSDPKWSGTVQHWMMDKNSKIMDLEGSEIEWIILNDLRSGYYRVNYDEETWTLILDIYKTKPEDLGEITKAQLLDDAFKLALNNYITIDIPLNMTKSLGTEESLVVWKVAMENFKILENVMRFSPNYGDFKNYMLSILNPIFNNIDPTQSKSALEALIYRWTCHFGNNDCKMSSQKLTTELIEKEFSNDFVVVDFQESILCAAVENSDSDVEKIFQAFGNVDSYKKIVLLKSLACTKEQWILNKYDNKLLC